MLPRVAAAVAASLALVAVAACTAAAPPAPTSPVSAPVPTPIAWPSRGPVVTPTPDSGNVGNPAYPELSVEAVDPETLRITLDDPSAKAWRVVLAGVGELADDRFELLVETGDVGPAITATEIRGGAVVDVMDLSGYADGTAAAGGCHQTLHVCIDSDGFRLPADGDGHFAVRLLLPDPATPLTITGGTAGWPGEPFVLGSWTDTQPFAWGDR